ncbi:NUDIX hydrolase [Candidatus Saccharibacteria bacterium]|nr:NUDIX hydrolase [Candidatus Saccharibacteria bacterium]
MPRVHVAKVVVTHNGNVLLLKRSDQDAISPGEWDLPGGKVEDGEDIITSAIRETYEETGLQTKNLTKIHAHLEPNGVTVLDMFLTTTDSSSVLLSDEHSEYTWLSTDKLDNFPLPDKYKQAIEKIS